jgi:hypothetical protein
MWPISSCTKVRQCCNPHVYWWNRIVLNNPTLLKTMWRFLDVCSWLVLSDNPRFQYYDVQTLEYMYISKLHMKKERIWSNVKETTSHLQNKLTKNIHLGVATRSSTWGLQHLILRYKLAKADMVFFSSKGN